MFFVAFNHRQNKMLAMLEKADMVQQANDRKNLLYIDDENADSPLPVGRVGDKTKELEGPPVSVILLRNEVDLE